MGTPNTPTVTQVLGRSLPHRGLTDKQKVALLDVRLRKLASVMRYMPVAELLDVNMRTGEEEPWLLRDLQRHIIQTADSLPPASIRGYFFQIPSSTTKLLLVGLGSPPPDWLSVEIEVGHEPVGVYVTIRKIDSQELLAKVGDQLWSFWDFLSDKAKAWLQDREQKADQARRLNHAIGWEDAQVNLFRGE